MYDKTKLVKAVSKILEYYESSDDKDAIFKASNLLMNKIKESEEYVELDSHFIEDILFVFNEDGTKRIIGAVFYRLKDLEADMKGVSFDNTHIKKISFDRLKNVEINIDKVPNKDISKCDFDGVTLTGSLDGANVEQTDFTGYIGDLTLNPQTVYNKSLYFTNLSGLTIAGSFDGVNIVNMDTTNVKNEIIINPQTIKDKSLWGVNCKGIRFVGEYCNGKYEDASFKDCSLYNTSFKGCIGSVKINLEELKTVIPYCNANFTGVELTGIPLDKSYGSYYEDENGKKIYLDEVYKVEEKDEETKSKIKNIIKRIFK